LTLIYNWTSSGIPITYSGTLEEVFHFVETKEAGKRSATRLLDNQAAAVAAVKSPYACIKRDNFKPTPDSKSQKNRPFRK
jgi:2-methylcitrate dehydratase PrpD